MGNLVGHVGPGFCFFLLGLWHLLNNIKLHALQPNSYKSLPWFPTSKIRYLELLFIMAACTMSIAMELCIGPRSHQPLDDTDGTIPPNHLHNFEHSSISMTFFIYAFFSIVLDRLGPKTQYSFTQLLVSVAFAQQLLLFHLHSADQMGIEGQYHMLLQIIVFISLATSILSINYPESFLLSFVRSLSILFQGLWLIVMGFMLWIPKIVPKGCFLNLEEGHNVVRCHTDEALERAKSLVNLEFSWYIILVMTFAMSLYLVLIRFYPEKIGYESLAKFEEREEDVTGDVEAQKQKEFVETRSFIHVGKSFTPIDVGR